jgi:phosphoesterase RecJ-like protein
MIETGSILELLSNPKDIVIFSHRNPDGDAIGSSLALQQILQKQFHNCKIVIPSEFPDELAFLKGTDDIIIYDKTPEKALDTISAAGLFFCLDFNSLSRIDKCGEKALSMAKPFITIDHHLYPEEYSNILISETAISSTCELLFQFVKAMKWSQYLDTNILESILTGIITDTGSFSYGVHPSTFGNVNEIINMGADIVYVQDKLNNQKKESQIRLLGHCLANRMRIWNEAKAGMIYLTKHDYTHFNILRGDTEGIVNYLLKLKDVNLAAFIMEQPGIIKISLRSKGNFCVEKMAKTYFSGGGHKNAAGGQSFTSMRNTISLLEQAIEDHKQEIINSF